MQSQRTRDIQRGQVLIKMDNAKQRCIGAMELALQNVNSTLWDECIRDAVRASSDYEIWCKVYEAIK